MSANPSPLKSHIPTRIGEEPKRGVWTQGDFLDLGGREAVDKVLQCLITTDVLRRIDRGLYDKPILNRLTQKHSVPDPQEVIDAIARRDQIRVLIDGMTAANDLGLTNAVPANIMVHADARLKPVTLGTLDIVFEPTAASKLYWAGRPATRLTKLLQDPDEGARLRTDLAEGLLTLPTWMQIFLRPLLNEVTSAASMT